VTSFPTHGVESGEVPRTHFHGAVIRTHSPGRLVVLKSASDKAKVASSRIAHSALSRQKRKWQQQQQ